jgi:hypothetical protein
MQNVVNKRIINVALKLQIYIINLLRIIEFLAFRHDLKFLYFIKYHRAVVKKNENANNLIKKNNVKGKLGHRISLNK